MHSVCKFALFFILHVFTHFVLKYIFIRSASLLNTILPSLSKSRSQSLEMVLSHKMYSRLFYLEVGSGICIIMMHIFSVLVLQKDTSFFSTMSLQTVTCNMTKIYSNIRGDSLCIYSCRLSIWFRFFFYVKFYVKIVLAVKVIIEKAQSGKK